MKHPFEGNDPDPEAQTRPMPCPECESTRGYSPVGPFRSQCLGCNALLKNQEISTKETR